MRKNRSRGLLHPARVRLLCADLQTMQELPGRQFLPGIQRRSLLFRVGCGSRWPSEAC